MAPTHKSMLTVHASSGAPVKQNKQRRNLDDIVRHISRGYDGEHRTVTDIGVIEHAVASLEVFPMSMDELKRTGLAPIMQAIRYQVHNRSLQKRIRGIIKAWQQLIDAHASTTVIPLHCQSVTKSSSSPSSAAATAKPSTNGCEQKSLQCASFNRREGQTPAAKWTVIAQPSEAPTDQGAKRKRKAIRRNAQLSSSSTAIAPVVDSTLQQSSRRHHLSPMPPPHRAPSVKRMKKNVTFDEPNAPRSSQPAQYEKSNEAHDERRGSGARTSISTNVPVKMSTGC